MLLFLCNFVSFVWGGFVCLLFIALWSCLGIASLCLLGKWYTVSIVAIVSTTSSNTQSKKIRIHSECSVLLQSGKKPHSTIIKYLYKFYPQSVPVPECPNVPLKVCIWKKHPSDKLNQNMLESQLLWVQVSSGAISSLPPSGVLFRQNLTISWRFLDRIYSATHHVDSLCMYNKPKITLETTSR